MKPTLKMYIKAIFKVLSKRFKKLFRKIKRALLTAFLFFKIFFRILFKVIWKYRYKVLCVVCAFAIVIVGIVSLIGYARKKAGDSTYQQLKENSKVTTSQLPEPIETVSFEPVVSVEEPVIEPPVPEIVLPRVNETEFSPIYDFDEIKSQNEEIYAWVNVPGSLIDYPVLQSEEDDFYLRRNLSKKSQTAGSLYTNRSINSMDFTDPVTIIYGHNMYTNHTMFGSIPYFLEKEFFDENRFIYISTEHANLTYEIQAVKIHSDSYLPYEYDNFSDEGFKSFVEMVKEPIEDGEKGQMVENPDITLEDRYVVLSTCEEKTDNRILLIGRLVEEALEPVAEISPVEPETVTE